MEKIEQITGKIFASIIIGIVIFSVLHSLFCFLFRDGRGTGLYGNRGNDYMYDDN